MRYYIRIILHKIIYNIILYNSNYIKESKKIAILNYTL